MLANRFRVASRKSYSLDLRRFGKSAITNSQANTDLLLTTSWERAKGRVQ